MSDSTIPFQGQTAVLDRPVTDLDPDQGEQAGGNRTKLLLLGGVAAVAVLGLLAYFLLFAGGEEPVAPATKPRAAAPAPAQPAADPVTPTQPRLSSKNFGRDPFKALIVEAPATTVPTGSAPVDTPVTGSTGTGSTGTGTSVPTASTPHTFKVADVASDNSTVSVKVDGKLYSDLQAGDVFAKYFKVVLISGQVNSFQYGEEKFNVIGTKRLTIA